MLEVNGDASIHHKDSICIIWYLRQKRISCEWSVLYRIEIKRMLLFVTTGFLGHFRK